MSISWSDAALAGLFWILTLYLFRPSAIRGQRLSDRRAFGPRFLILFLAISLSFQIDPLAARFDALVGVNNLSWLLAYGNAVVAAYAGVLAMVTMAKGRVARTINIVTVLMLSSLLLLFPALANTSEEIHNHLPESVALLIYRELLYVYLTFMAIIGIRIHWNWLQNEKYQTGKFRGSILLLSLSSGVAFFGLRAIASLFVYFNPHTVFYGPLLTISNILAATAIAGLACSFAPPLLFRFPIRVFSYLEQRLTLHDLEYLRNQMIASTGELPWPPPSQRERWFDTPYALYCTLIDILDRRNLLRALVIHNSPKIGARDRRVADRLETLPNTKDWVELLPHLRNVARKL